MITQTWDEVWLPIAGYEDLYQISDQGRVRSLFPRWGGTPIILKPVAAGGGYLGVSLWKAGRDRRVLIHRLVAAAFHPDHDPAHQVNHIDGDKLNATARNLEWVSPKDNCRHARVTGLHIPYNSKLTPEKVRAIRTALANGRSQTDIAREFGVAQTGISKIALGQTWAHVH